MKKIILVCLLALVACNDGGSGNQSDNDDDGGLPFYPFDFDEETPDGMMIETRGHAIPPLATLDQWYAETLQCVGDEYTFLGYPNFQAIDAPPIIIDDDLRSLCGSGASGIYCQSYAIPFIGILDGHAMVKETWKHEFIHHILTENDFPEDLNKNHEPPSLWSCRLH